MSANKQTLPTKPSFMAPVTVDPGDLDGDALAGYYAQTTRRANSRLTKSGSWYDCVRRAAAQKTPKSCK